MINHYQLPVTPAAPRLAAIDNKIQLLANELTGEDSAVSFHVDCGNAGKEERQAFTNNSVTVLDDASADNSILLRFTGGFLKFSDNTVTSA